MAAGYLAEEGASGLIPVDEYRKCGVKMLTSLHNLTTSGSTRGAGLGWCVVGLPEGRNKVFDTPRLRPCLTSGNCTRTTRRPVIENETKAKRLMARRARMVMVVARFARSPEGGGGACRGWRERAAGGVGFTAEERRRGESNNKRTKISWPF